MAEVKQYGPEVDRLVDLIKSQPTLIEVDKLGFIQDVDIRAANSSFVSITVTYIPRSQDKAQSK